MSRMRSEGVIQFDCRWIRAPLALEISIRSINFWRDRLRRRGFIGLYPNGYGYGNLSLRLGRSKKFLITGSQTEGIAKLGRKHYTVVESYSIRQNRLTCRGPIRASSESLTHAMVYEAGPSACAVMHVHHRAMWKKLLNRLPTTSFKASYGTPYMAREVLRLFRQTDLPDRGIFVMGGHPDGLVVFGRDFPKALHVLVRYLHQLGNFR